MIQYKAENLSGVKKALVNGFTLGYGFLDIGEPDQIAARFLLFDNRRVTDIDLNFTPVCRSISASNPLPISFEPWNCVPFLLFHLSLQGFDFFPLGHLGIQLESFFKGCRRCLLLTQGGFHDGEMKVHVSILCRI
jgi:hypothetical protein